MAEKERNKAGADQPAEETAKRKGRLLKFGVPVLLIQVIVAYFLASSIIVPSLVKKATAEDTDEAKAKAVADKEEEASSEQDFGAVYKLEDIIVNPAQSRGAQFVLVNLAFEVAKDDEVKELEKREVQLRDIIIRLISSRTIDQLDDASDKDSLRVAIAAQVESAVPKLHLRNVYFSNYIIQ
ncbi:MAG: hypothetical protein D6715_10755 [Calditrichaeota bacterium]|nr:MAG: hypothetical protein D6715_10755 [Calditrichota bacterium]